MNSQKQLSPLKRLVEIRRNTGTLVACFLALVVVPAIGLFLLFGAEGKLRAIGLGFLVYSFALFVVLPGLILAAGEKRGSNTRLFASLTCFVLAFFVFFYLSYTVVGKEEIKFIVTIPISLLGIVFAIWWARDCIGFDDSQ